MQTNKITAKSLHRNPLKYIFLNIDNEFKVRFSVGRRHRGPQLDCIITRLYYIKSRFVYEFFSHWILCTLYGCPFFLLTLLLRLYALRINDSYIF